jgi:hypothetical protein
MFEIWKFVDV